MTNQTMTCSFCGRGPADVPGLLAGAEAKICADCVQVCIETFAEAGLWPIHSPAALHRGLMALAAYIGPKCVSAVNAAVAGQPAGEGV